LYNCRQKDHTAFYATIDILTLVALSRKQVVISFFFSLSLCLGMNLPKETGYWITLSGYIFSSFAVGYSTFLHGGRVFGDLKEQTKVRLFVSYYGTLFASGKFILTETRYFSYQKKFTY
jgi:hypothetical protein